MASRRAFLTAGFGGLAFCSCGMLDHARAQPSPSQSAGAQPVPAPTRLPVTIAGQRVRTVDMHAHCYFQDAVDLMGADAAKVMPPTKGVPEHFLATPDVLAQRMAGMDAMGIDMEVLSINPYWYGKDRETAGRITEMQNAHLATLRAAHPDRFGAYASLPMQFPDLAVEQLDYAVRKQGFVGAAIGGSVGGESFSSPRFRPVLAKAEELGCILFIHPQTQPELAKRYAGNGWLSNLIGNPLDTTIALQKLIFDGTLDRHPGLKVLAAHGGGYLGSYAPRSDHACFISPQSCSDEIVLKKKPTEYLNQLYFDALVFTPEALRHLVAQVGASQVVLGTDFPIPWETHPIDHVMATPELTDAQRAAILGGNAARLMSMGA